MTYLTYRRFKRDGIEGHFNLPFNTPVTEKDGFLYYDNKLICAVTSENGWEHFRPNTAEGEYRQAILNDLYQYYQKNGSGDDFDEAKWPNQTNYYWKNLLRTAPTERLEKIYQARIGDLPKEEVK